MPDFKVRMKISKGWSWRSHNYATAVYSGTANPRSIERGTSQISTFLDDNQVLKVIDDLSTERSCNLQLGIELHFVFAM